MHFFKMILLCLYILTSFPCSAAEEKRLNIYIWFDVIPQSVIKTFEEETGIKVILDFYDSNQTLEAQLLTKNTGYDLVSPSAWPFMARQAQKGLFQVLDKSKLSNWSHLNAELLTFLAEVDPGNQYAVPLHWGVTGIGYNRAEVKKLLPHADLDSWSLIFDPKNAKALSHCGLYILDEASDVFSSALAYLGLPPDSKDANDLKKAYELLSKVRPYVRRFETYKAMSDLANGEACVAQNWSGDVAVSRQRAIESKNGVDIDYIIPKEGTALWIDTLAIPADAPHPENAHLFINFLMRPQIAAMITNEMLFTSANKDAFAYIKEDIRNNPIIYPPDDILKRAYVGRSPQLEHERTLNRLMMNLKLGRE